MANEHYWWENFAVSIAKVFSEKRTPQIDPVERQTKRRVRNLIAKNFCLGTNKCQHGHTNLHTVRARRWLWKFRNWKWNNTGRTMYELLIHRDFDLPSVAFCVFSYFCFNVFGCEIKIDSVVRFGSNFKNKYIVSFCVFWVISKFLTQFSKLVLIKTVQSLSFEWYSSKASFLNLILSFNSNLYRFYDIVKSNLILKGFCRHKIDFII